MTVFYAVMLFVVLQRLGELALAAHNTRRLKAEGGIEKGAEQYPFFILLHGSWLLAIVLATPPETPADLRLLALFILLQLGRVWIIASLGRFWTTRIITVPGAALVKKGPYRFLRHPNYWLVVIEIAVLPLMFGDWKIAVLWSVMNALLLRWRVAVEDAALEGRRHSIEHGQGD